MSDAQTVLHRIFLPACVFLMLVCAQNVWASKAIGKVTSIEGKAYATVEGSRRDLKMNAEVYRQDTLHTLHDASLGITFIDETILEMGENSSVVLEEYEFEDKPGGLMGMVTKMLRGLVRMATGKIVERDRESFELKTPLASLGIRGTEFFAMTTPEGEEIGVTAMDEGHVVALKSDTDQTTIDKEGFYVKVGPDGRFSSMMRITKKVTRQIMRVQGSALRKSVVPKPKPHTPRPRHP